MNFEEINVKQEVVMVYSLNEVQELVDEIILPQHLIYRDDIAEKVVNWQNLVHKNLKQVRLYFIEDPGSGKEKRRIATQLVHLSDQVFRYKVSLWRIWGHSANKEAIGKLYAWFLLTLENALDELKQIEPAVGEYLAITKYGLTNEMLRVKSKLQELRQHLAHSDIDQTLRRLTLNGLQRSLRREFLSSHDIEYVIRLTVRLTDVSLLSTSKLEDLLYQLNFNFPEFFLYYVTQWQARLLEIPGLHEQLEALLKEVDRLNTLSVNQKQRLLKEENSVDVEFKLYLTEKLEIIGQLLKLRRVVLKDQDLTKNSLRTKINLSVAQFGLFIRLQVEKGLLPKENIGELFSFFAANFYTPQTAFMSAESLQKKSSDVEYATASKVKGYLIEMINWLNEHFKFSDTK